MARRLSSPVFIGRRPELERLEQALAAATGGEPQVLLVAGDAGVGKTRLVAEFVSRARASGCQVLSGGCVSVGEAGLPFAAVGEALRGLHRTLGRAGFEALAGPARGELARLVPDLAPGAPLPAEVSTGAWEQARLFELLLGFLGRLAARSPTVFVIEDLHWADEATRGLVAFLVRNLGDERLLLVATVRSDDLHRRHPLMPLLAELRRSPRVERIELVPFDRDELAEQLAGILGREPEPALLAEIAERSEGNAYLAEELAAVGLSARLPGTVEEVLLARVGRLTQPAQDLLRVASAAGSRIDIGLLAAVASEIGGESTAAIQELVDEHVLVRRDDQGEERYTFRHALLQEAVYGQLLPSERTRYHEAFARTLAQRGRPRDASTAAELAHQWEAAGNLPRAFRASIDAARATAGIFAFEDALQLLERAVVLWEYVPNARELADLDRPGLLALAATTAEAAGADARSAIHQRAAVELLDVRDDPVRAGLLRERLARYTAYSGASADSLAVARAAVDVVPRDPPTAARARVLAGLAFSLMRSASAEEGTATANDAIAVAQSVGALDIEADALATLAATLAHVGRVHESVAASRRAREIAVELGDDLVVMRAWSNLVAALESVDLAACVAEAVAAASWADEHGRAASAVTRASQGSRALYQLGRWDEAEQMLPRLRVTPEGELALVLDMSRAEIAIGRGDVGAAQRSLGAARGHALGIEWAGYTVAIAGLATRLALAGGDLSQGRRLAEPGLMMLPELLPGVASDTVILLDALRVETELADRARARGARAQVVDALDHGRGIIDLARSVTTSIATRAPEIRRRPEAVLALCEAEWSLLQGASSAALWAAAAEACAVADQLQLRPYAQYRQAEAKLAAKADRSEVARMLSDAHAAVVAMGARPLQNDIESLAERARIPLGPKASPSARRTEAMGSDRFGLSPRELEVLSLVAQGRTNRQIGAELFISEKTAGVHVSNILGKLGASGRTEAAAIAHRLGLVR